MARRPRFGPGMLAEAGQFCFLFHQFRRQLRLAVIIAADLADIHRRRAERIAHQVGIVLARGQQLCDPRIGDQHMLQAGKLGKLPGAELHPALGHHHFLVPAQDRGSASHEVRFDDFRGELFVDA